MTTDFDGSPILVLTKEEAVEKCGHTNKLARFNKMDDPILAGLLGCICAVIAIVV